MEKTPVVSVLMTAYNRQEFIKEAIESVLRSWYLDFELIIVDDCSNDNTYAIAKSYEQIDSRVRVYQNDKNLGDYPNRNRAASYATGKYIKYLDSDDIMYPHCLQVMVAGMEQFPEAGYALSAKGDPNCPYPVLLSSKEAYLEHFYTYGHFDRAPGSVIIRKNAFDKVGGFSGERMIGDTDLWFKMSMYFPTLKVFSELYWARTHSNQEQQSSYAQQQYRSLREAVVEKYFNDVNCPLTTEEKRQINKMLKKRLHRIHFLLFITHIYKFLKRFK
ncbi:MAG: glycosyltransferase family 2 protein [Bacteroidetes bacterium]|nr:glycosyltransferase family 2 protein [Bacteroidota bacterium]